MELKLILEINGMQKIIETSSDVSELRPIIDVYLGLLEQSGDLRVQPTLPGLALFPALPTTVVQPAASADQKRSPRLSKSRLRTPPIGERVIDRAVFAWTSIGHPVTLDELYSAMCGRGFKGTVATLFATLRKPRYEGVFDRTSSGLWVLLAPPNDLQDRLGDTEVALSISAVSSTLRNSGK